MGHIEVDATRHRKRGCSYRHCNPRIDHRFYLQIGDDGVLHVLFLFLQEVETHGIESVRAQFVVSEENLEERGGDFYPLITTCSPTKFFFPNLMHRVSAAATDLQQVKLNPALHVYRLVLSAAHLLALEVQVTQDRLDTSHSAQVGEEIHLHTDKKNSFVKWKLRKGRLIIISKHSPQVFLI